MRAVSSQGSEYDYADKAFAAVGSRGGDTVIFRLTIGVEGRG